MKKIDRILLLIGILVISLCGCTNQNDSLENGNENNISNVLFLYEGSATIFDQYDYNFDDKIVRD